MKKRLLCFLLAVLCVIPLTLAGCGDDSSEVVETTTKALTLNLYGITNESTTEEAVLAVQDAMNAYTEGKFNTHIVLHLYPENEYYKVLDEKLAGIETKIAEEEAEAKRKKEEARAQEKAGNATKKAETTAVETEAETYLENGATKTVYPAEKETQLDIFMVQGAANLNRYYEAEYLSPLSDALANSSKKLYDYIISGLFATVTLGGAAQADGSVSKGTVYGIPNNNVYGEYTYLLVNKELASKYYYSAADVSTLADLANYLDDVSKNHPDYITLYNEPTINIEYLTDKPSLIGTVVTNATNGFTRAVPRNMLNISSYTNYLQTVYDYEKAGYITEGDYYSFPKDEEGNDKKVAAAFLKGDASLPTEYEEDYYVITYAKPVASASDRPGTMFCVSTFTSNVDRCMEIITALQTDASFRNIFQYGVEGTHYEVDEYTGMVNILNNDYSMNAEDTGNLFLLYPNSSMSEQMLKLAENNWALAKQQNLDTVTSPYCMFNFQIVTKDNYKSTSIAYKEAYEAAVDAAKDEQGKSFDESKFVFEYDYPYEYTDVILEEMVKLSEEVYAKIDAFEEYTDEDGEVVTLKDYLKILRKEVDNNEYYLMLIDSMENVDSPLSQYNAWYDKNGPQIAG